MYGGELHEVMKRDHKQVNVYVFSSFYIWNALKHSSVCGYKHLILANCWYSWYWSSA